MATKIEGFNSKEQRVYELLLDGEQHDIREMKALFSKEARAHVKEVYEEWDESTVDSQAQSYVRNSIRRLIRDGWAEGPAQNDKLPRGTYRLSKLGKEKVKRGTAKTASADARKKKRVKKEAKPKAEKAAKVAKPKTEKKAKVAKPKAEAKPKKTAKPKAEKKAASTSNGNSVVEKAEAAKKNAAKEAAREKAEAARSAAAAAAAN